MIWSTLKYTIKREMRDKVSLFLMLIFPIILVLIVGVCLKSHFEAPPFDKAKIAVIDLDKSRESKVFLDIFGEDNIKKLIDVKQDIVTVDEAKKIYESKKIDGYIEIPKNFGFNANNGKEAKLILTEDGSNSQAINVVKQMIDEFNSGSNLLNVKGIDNKKLDIINSIYSEKMVHSVGINQDHIPRSIDYYGVTLLVMICMYGSLYVIRMMSETLYEECGIRLKTITNSDYKIHLGIILASFIVVSIQILILIGVFKIGYGVYYGGNIWKVFILLGSMCIFSKLMGTLIIRLFKSYSISYTIAQVLILSLTFLAGGFVILDLGNGMFGNIVENYLPNAVCQNAIFSAIYDTNSVSFGQALCVILTESFVVLIISILLKRKESIV